MTITAKTTEGTKTTATEECTRCNGHRVMWTRLGYRKFDMVICGQCEGTGLEPAAEDHTYSAFYHLFDHGHRFA